MDVSGVKVTPTVQQNISTASMAGAKTRGRPTSVAPVRVSRQSAESEVTQSSEFSNQVTQGIESADKVALATNMWTFLNILEVVVTYYNVLLF